MALDNLKDFNIQWVTISLLFFSLMTFTLFFMYNNSPDALGEYGDKFETTESGIQSKLIAVEGDSNTLLNVSSQNNPEVSDLGSKDSVGTSYGVYGSSKSFIDQIKLFMDWVLVGTASQVLISVMIGLFGMMGLYLIVKWIRSGI